MSQNTPSSETEIQEKHLNAQTIVELKELLGDNKFKYLVEVFCENSNKSAEVLLKNDIDYDFEELYAAAHSMAGSSANMGAMILCELCRQLEQQAKVQSHEHIPTLIEGIIAEQKQVLTEFAELVS